METITIAVLTTLATLALLLMALFLESWTWHHSRPISREGRNKERQSLRFALAILVAAGLWALGFFILYFIVSEGDLGWSVVYVVAQSLYFLSLAVIIYFLTRRVDWVDPRATESLAHADMPLIVLAYPVLHEDENTMHSTMVALSRIDYPRDKYRVIAIPNTHDKETIAALKRLQGEFPFLEIMEVPPTDGPFWNVVWHFWQANPKAYWFHKGKTAGVTDLPPKKTRQLIYLLYNLTVQIGSDWVLDYIDADSLVPANHFKLAAVGLKEYDVLQSTNVVGNLLDTWATSFHAFDHMCWDGNIYPHMSAGGKHPYYLLGKGLFYKVRDLIDLGGFNPWITIEDPEVGLRLWANGKRLGIIAEPLVEESPRSFIGGVVQRNRWICGFFQSLTSPLRYMGMKFWDRQKARINLVPNLALLINGIGLPTGVYALYRWIEGTAPFGTPVMALSVINVGLYVAVIGQMYINAWRRTKLVLNSFVSRVWYMIRINPMFLFLYHLIWAIPVVSGFAMYLANQGKVWVTCPQ